VRKIRGNGAGIYEVFKTVFIEEAVSRTQVFDWFRCLKYGCTSVEINEISWRPESNRNEDMIAKAHDIVTADLRTICREVAVVKRNFVSRKGNLTNNMGRRLLSTKFLPLLLTAVASYFLENLETDENFPENFVTLPQNYENLDR
jgi:hypothetical protein